MTLVLNWKWMRGAWHGGIFMWLYFTILYSRMSTGCITNVLFLFSPLFSHSVDRSAEKGWRRICVLDRHFEVRSLLLTTLPHIFYLLYSRLSLSLSLAVPLKYIYILFLVTFLHYTAHMMQKSEREIICFSVINWLTPYCFVEKNARVFLLRDVKYIISFCCFFLSSSS